jgi:hypothetical protein
LLEVRVEYIHAVLYGLRLNGPNLRGSRVTCACICIQYTFTRC